MTPRTMAPVLFYFNPLAAKVRAGVGEDVAEGVDLFVTKRETVHLCCLTSSWPQRMLCWTTMTTKLCGRQSETIGFRSYTARNVIIRLIWAFSEQRKRAKSTSAVRLQ